MLPLAASWVKIDLECVGLWDRPLFHTKDWSKRCHLETWRNSLDRTQPPTVVREPRRGSHDLVVPGQTQKDVDDGSR